jgi:hypothetical protein
MVVREIFLFAGRSSFALGWLAWGGELSAHTGMARPEALIIMESQEKQGQRQRLALRSHGLLLGSDLPPSYVLVWRQSWS